MFGANGLFATSSVYVKDTTATFTYELPATPTTVPTLLDQMNAQGAKGFKWGGPYFVGGANYTLYRKSSDSTSTYTYLLPSAQGVDTSAALLVQANAQGANGYYYMGPQLIGQLTVNVYQKDSAGAAKYSYETLAPATTDTAFLDQLNSQGGKGLRFRTAYVFGNEGIKNIYEKDTSQSPLFSYSVLDSSINISAFVTQANAQGAKFSVVLGPYVLPSSANKNLYFSATNCTGFLCDPRSLFGF